MRMSEDAALAAVRAGQTVWMVEDRPRSGEAGDIWQTFWTDRSEAVRDGASQWDHLTPREQAHREIEVGAAVEDCPDTMAVGPVTAGMYPEPSPASVERVVTLRAAGYSTVATVSEMADKLGVEVGDQVRIKMSKI